MASFKKEYESFPNIVHGGIISSVLDEVAGISLMKKYHLFPFLHCLNIKFHSALKTDRELICISRVDYRFGRYILASSEVIDSNGRVYASSEGLYYLPTRSQFEKVTGITSASKEIRSYIEQNN